MEFQHINVKLFVKDAERVDMEALVPVFHGWIQNQSEDELLLDVADYRHVRSGPGIVLIGHYGNYSLDNTGGRLGVRYNRKAILEGTNQDRFIQAAQAALTACERLENDPRLGGMIRFHGREMELFINDRLLAANTLETRHAAESETQAFFATLLGGSKYVVSYARDARSLFSLQVKTDREFETTDLLQNLNALAPTTC